jgi:hypothetical protein
MVARPGPPPSWLVAPIELRLVSRYRRKLNAMCTSQINRLHKILDDAGIKLGAVVSDIHGVSARAMVRGLIEGQSEPELLAHARGALKRKTEALAASLDGDLSERHLFVMRHLSDSIEGLQHQLAEIDAYLMAAMQPYSGAHGLLQTIPGIDEVAAALILIEIGDDMARFGSPERLACWAALSPGNHESAGKRQSGRTRHGNHAVRYILFTADSLGSGPADFASMLLVGRHGHVPTSGGFHGNVGGAAPAAAWDPGTDNLQPRRGGTPYRCGSPRPTDETPVPSAALLMQLFPQNLPQDSHCYRSIVRCSSLLCSNSLAQGGIDHRLVSGTLRLGPGTEELDHVVVKHDGDASLAR